MQTTAAPADAELIEASARGERLAQSEMMHRCIAQQCSTVTPFEWLAFAEVFARQAASHGHVEDRLALSGVLRVRAMHVADLGDLDRAHRLLAQAEALCGDLSGITFCGNVEFLAGVLTAQIDTGSREAETLFDRIVAALSPDEAVALRNCITTAVREVAQAMEALSG